MAFPKDPIKTAPFMGAILKCNFDGLVDPEMIKTRPVVVIAPPIRQRPRLCTIVPLSTTEPNPAMPYHLKIDMPKPQFPPPFDRSFAWMKGDMVYAVSFDRLEKFYYEQNNIKHYITPRLDNKMMQEVQRRILRGLGLRSLEKAFI